MIVHSCPFCSPPTDRLIAEGERILALWDTHPVSPGHALIIPRRHVTDWFSATDAERAALTAAIADVRREIERHHRPDGYNIGINVGEAAGQTVFHLHVHVIPRYRGDVAQPRGGVRGVIPSRADYPHKP
jgi:ATP adenylyltransferase